MDQNDLEIQYMIKESFQINGEIIGFSMILEYLIATAIWGGGGKVGPLQIPNFILFIFFKCLFISEREREREREWEGQRIQSGLHNDSSKPDGGAHTHEP